MRACVSVLILFLMMSFGVSAVQAQTSPAVMAAKIEALERQLRGLQQRLNTSDGVGVASTDQTDVAIDVGDRRLIADISAQLGTMSRQIRQLTGRLEEYEYRQNQLSETLDQMRTQMALQREQLLTVGNSASSNAPPQNVGAATETRQTSRFGAGEEPLEQLPVVQLPEGDAAAQYTYAFSFVQKNDLESGRVAMEQFLAANGDDARVANAKFWLGRINMQQGNNAEAARLFLNLIEEHPNHNRRADALIDLAGVLVALDAAEDACNALAEFRRIEDDASDRLKARARRIASDNSCDVF